jgi:hypothetical protein
MLLAFCTDKAVSTLMVYDLQLEEEPINLIRKVLGYSKMSNDSFHDNQGRRSGINRRHFSYTLHLPERRGGKERRSGLDRRNKIRPSSHRNASEAFKLKKPLVVYR